jgi:hypothetical protein
VQFIGGSDKLKHCLDLFGANTTNSASVGLWECIPNEKSQQWKFSAVPPGPSPGPAPPSPAPPPVPPFCGQILLKANLNKCMDFTNGAKIDVWDCSATPIDGQNWIYDSSTSQIKNLKDQTKCIDLRGGSEQAGNTVEIWECDSSTPNQQWTLQQKSGYFLIVYKKNTKFCMDIGTMDFKNGDPVQIQ